MLGVIVMRKPVKNRTNRMIDFKQRMSKAEIAELLHSIANKLETDGQFTLTQGDKVHEVTPSATPVVEIEYREKNGKYKFEFELEWRPNDSQKNITIE